MAWAALLVALQEPSPEGAYFDRPTGLRFPVRIGELRRVDVTRFEDERLGVAVTYSWGEFLTITIYRYDLGRHVIRDGPDSEEVRAEMAKAKREIEIMRRRGSYNSTERLSDATRRLGEGEGAVEFLVATLRVSFEEGGEPYLSQIYVTGYRNSFLKLRCTYLEDRGEDAERHRDRLLEFLRRGMRRPAPVEH